MKNSVGFDGSNLKLGDMKLALRRGDGNLSAAISRAQPNQLIYHTVENPELYWLSHDKELYKLKFERVETPLDPR